MLTRGWHAVAVFLQPVQAARPAFAVEINHKEPGFLASRDAYQRRARADELPANGDGIAAGILEPARGDGAFLPIAGKDRPALGEGNGAIDQRRHGAHRAKPRTTNSASINNSGAAKIMRLITAPPLGSGADWRRKPSCGHPSEIGAAPLPCLGGVVCCGSSRKRSLPVTV